MSVSMLLQLYLLDNLPLIQSKIPLPKKIAKAQGLVHLDASTFRLKFLMTYMSHMLQ